MRENLQNRGKEVFPVSLGPNTIFSATRRYRGRVERSPRRDRVGLSESQGSKKPVRS
jgi:hypothetical protein